MPPGFGRLRQEEFESNQKKNKTKQQLEGIMEDV
jgi:hypothetical protein